MHMQTALRSRAPHLKGTRKDGEASVCPGSALPIGAPEAEEIAAKGIIAEVTRSPFPVTMADLQTAIATRNEVSEATFDRALRWLMLTRKLVRHHLGPDVLAYSPAKRRRRGAAKFE
jgi:hypothetical protein